VELPGWGDGRDLVLYHGRVDGQLATRVELRGDDGAQVWDVVAGRLVA
jgi:hypothetical protein